MVLSVPLSAELESRLRREAERQGMPVDALMLDLLDKYLPQEGASRRTVAVAMLQSWAEEDAALSDEAAAENATVLRELDEHRSSYRKLFDGLLGDKPGGATGAT